MTDAVGASPLLAVKHGAVLVMTMNRPHARNAITGAMAESLSGAIARLNDDPALRVGVLVGAGESFCAGIDLKDFAVSGPPKGLRELLRARSMKPMIAAIEGFALAGGLELALMCDLIVAARGSKLGLPEAKVGLLAVGGGLFRLPVALATEMGLTGTAVSAEHAAEHGLVTRLSEPGLALETALALASTIASNAPLSIAATLDLIRARSGRSEEQLWELQAPVRDKVFASADAREGATAFGQKRSPQWTGT